MSQRFEIIPIRKAAANGALDGIGIEWTEEASLRHSNRLPMWFALVLCIGCAALALIMTAAGGGLLAFAAFAAFAATAGYTIYWQLGPLPRRSVVFMRDGRIAVPHGIPGEKHARRLRRTQADIASIEIGPSRSGMQQDWTRTVQFVSAEGLTDTISQKMHAEEGREVAVRLGRALHEMRQTVGRGPLKAEAVQAQPSQARRPALID